VDPEHTRPLQSVICRNTQLQLLLTKVASRYDEFRGLRGDAEGEAELRLVLLGFDGVAAWD
jgi:hypothetical protein